MKVLWRPPTREVDVAGPATVQALLEELEILPDTVLVIRDGELLMRTDRLRPDDRLELRPVISGG